MVLFENINLNQRVEVLRAGVVYSGTVKYKGCINGVRGEWVGIDLDQPEGQHDGMLNARRYFLCRPGHGIFTTASQIRFVPMRRCLWDKYRTIERRSEIDPDLFEEGGLAPVPVDPKHNESWIDSTYHDRAVSAQFETYHAADVYSSQRRYPLRHSISGRQPSAIMLRPELEKAKCFGAAASSQRSHAHHHYDAASPPFTKVHSGNSRIIDVDFISPPTIPKPHVPHSVLKRQVRRAGAGLHNPRVMTVNTGRDAIKLAQWNDISA